MIRAFQKSDLEQLVNIVQSHIPISFAEEELTDFKDYIKTHHDTYFTIIRENKVAGGIGYLTSKDCTSGSIRWIFTHVEYMGKGVAKEAILHCLSILKTISTVEEILVDTSQLAFKLFEKFGFRTIDTRKDYWGTGLDLYKMKLNLHS